MDLTTEPLVNRLREYVENAKEAKGELETQWAEWTDFYDGDQWGNIPSAAESWINEERVTINLLKQTVDTIIPIALDAIPTWYVRAYDPNADDIAKSLENYLQGLLYELKVPQAYELALQDSCVLGTGALKVYPNSHRTRLASVIGVPEQAQTVWPWVSYLNPRSIFPDPDSENLEDCEYLCLRNVMPEAMVSRLFGVDPTTLEAENTADRTGTWLYRLTEHSHSPRRQLWEVYHEFGARLTIFSNRTILWDGPSPIPEDRYPVVLFQLGERGSNLWGLGAMFGGGERLQESANKLATRMLVHARVCAAPKWEVHGPMPEQFDNSPGGTVNFPGEAGSVKPLVPPEFPSYGMPMMALLLQLWESWTGVREVLQGRRPVGVTAGVAIQSLQESATTRLRQLVRRWSNQFGEVGQQLLSLVTAYTVGDRTSFREGATGIERATVKSQEIQDETGRPRQFRVVVAPTNDLPMGQSQVAQVVMQLAPQLGMAALPVIMEALRIPGRERIMGEVQRIAQNQLQSSYAQQIEAQMQEALTQQAQGQAFNEEAAIQEGQAPA